MGRRRTKTATSIVFLGTRGEVLLRAAVPASAGDASLSFLGVVFPSARVATVRITTGNVPPGPRTGSAIEVVMMDDFIYGEPQMIGGASSIDDESEMIQEAVAPGDN